MSDITDEKNVSGCINNMKSSKQLSFFMPADKEKKVKLCGPGDQVSDGE